MAGWLATLRVPLPPLDLTTSAYFYELSVSLSYSTIDIDYSTVKDRIIGSKGYELGEKSEGDGSASGQWRRTLQYIGAVEKNSTIRPRISSGHLFRKISMEALGKQALERS